MSYRIGQGFDIHPLIEGRPFMLGGIQLESEVGPDGHSDGDVILHALTDALLGATGLGDIGEWFPPSDEKFKNAKSSDLLLTVYQRIQENGYLIENIDITVILETPKLGEYKNKIRSNLSKLLAIELNQVSVKAKTAEKMLGELGQGQAVTAMVVCLLYNNN